MNSLTEKLGNTKLHEDRIEIDKGDSGNLMDVDGINRLMTSGPFDHCIF